MKAFLRPALRLPLLLLLAFPSALLADLKLTFTVTRETSPPSPPPPNETPRSLPTSVVTVVLGENYFCETSGANVLFIDFSRRRSYQVNTTERAFSNTSLFAHVGFLEAELAHRLRLAQGLNAVGLNSQNVFDPVLVEHALSLRLPSSTSKLTPAAGSDRLAYTHGEKPLASFQRTGFAIAAAEAAQFARYLRYSYALHPDILAALPPLRIVPAEFQIHRYADATDRIQFALTKSERVDRPPTAASILNGLSERPPESNELRAALALTPADFKRKCDAVLRSALAAAKSKRYADALLLFLEHTLSTGEPFPAEFGLYKTAIEADADCQLYLSSRRPTTHEEAELAVKNLQLLEAKSPPGRAVLKILRANQLSQLRRPAESVLLIQEALAEKPHLLGAWRDLGFLYGGNFRMDLAWTWWDAARRLLPGHKQWSSIEDLEQKLLRDHPEFF